MYLGDPRLLWVILIAPEILDAEGHGICTSRILTQFAEPLSTLLIVIELVAQDRMTE
jgi:hypothetical protein